MKRFLFPTVAFLFVLFGCSAAYADLPAEDVRDLPAFEGIGIAVSADVFYTQGDQHQVRIEGDEDDVRDLITEVEDGFLQIRYKDRDMHRSKLTIYITSGELSSLKIAGSARFLAGKQVNSDEMEISMSGSGGATFNQLSSGEMEIKISGSGSVVLAGEGGNELEVKLSGSGQLNAEEFKVSEATVAISGSGNCTVYATGELDAKISGSGRVHYRGDPQVNSVTSGSGRVSSL